MYSRFSVLFAVVASLLAGSSASAQSPKDMTEDDCRRIYLVEANPQDWNAFDECRRNAVQIKPDEPNGLEAPTPQDRSVRDRALESRRPDGRS